MNKTYCGPILSIDDCVGGGGVRFRVWDVGFRGPVCFAFLCW